MPHKGYKPTEEAKRNLRLSHLGQKAWNKGKKGFKWSEETRKKQVEAHKGEKAYNYIKDRSKVKQSERKDLDTQYRCWRQEIRKRDFNKCRLASGECKGRLESHHIFSWRDYPELRYLMNNGITLCSFHHPRKWSEEKRMIPILQELLANN